MRRLNGSNSGSGEVRSVGRPRTIEAGQSSLALVLNLIRTGAATTRQDIERESELGRAAVTDRLAALTDLKLTGDGELGEANGGRAPRHVAFRTQAGVILVAVVDHVSIAVGIADLSGRLLAEHHEALDGPGPIYDRLQTLLTWMRDEQAEGGEVWGIGIAVPGPVEQPDDGMLATGPAGPPEWQGRDFAGALAVHFGAPVYVRNGVQMMAMGELKAGSALGVQDVLFVNLGRSISAAIISDGQLHRGAQGAAGLIGHVPTGEEGTMTCRCGSRGCLEAVAGADAVAREAAAAARDGRSRYLAETLARNGDVTATDVGHGAQIGDGFCAELIARCGRLVGESLAPLANLLNPALIILGGMVAQTGDILLAAVREAVYRQSHPLVTRDLQILRSHMGGSAGLVGSAQFVVDELFAPPMLKGWIHLGTPRLHPELHRFILDARKEQQRKVERPEPPKMSQAAPKRKSRGAEA